MQNHGLEWLHRMASEPTRFNGRYSQTNSILLLKALRQLARRPSPRISRTPPSRDWAVETLHAADYVSPLFSRESTSRYTATVSAATESG
jgi:hypothetical protein